MKQLFVYKFYLHVFICPYRLLVLFSNIKLDTGLMTTTKPLYTQGGRVHDVTYVRHNMVKIIK